MDAILVTAPAAWDDGGTEDSSSSPPDDTSGALAELAGLLLSTDTFEELLHGVARLSVRTVDAAVSCGITLADNRDPAARTRHRRLQRHRPGTGRAVRRARLRPAGQRRGRPARGGGGGPACARHRGPHNPAGRPLDAAALNAGVGRGGAFLDTDIADEVEIIDLNITSTVRLAERVLRDMAARGEGRVLITSSIASTMPGSFQAVYNASKSFLQSFAEALQSEMEDTGVTITSLMPGPTDTDFFRRADMLDTSVGSDPADDPAQVAKQGFDALMKGKGKVVAGGMSTKAQGAAAKVLPDRVKAAMHRSTAEPGSAEQ